MQFLVGGLGTSLSVRGKVKNQTLVHAHSKRELGFTFGIQGSESRIREQNTAGLSVLCLNVAIAISQGTSYMFSTAGVELFFSSPFLFFLSLDIHNNQGYLHRTLPSNRKRCLKAMLSVCMCLFFPVTC